MADGAKKLSKLTADDAEEIIRDNYNAIYKYCYWQVKNCSDAEDLTQETFLHFVQAISDYSDRGKPKAFLYTIAKNLCINFRKKSKAISLADIDNTAFEESKAEEIENKIILEKYIRELTSEQQEILLLRYGQELQVNEIAKILNLNRFAVMYRMKTSIKNLKKKLENGGYSFEK